MEKVLKLKYDPTTQTNFLDETMKVCIVHTTIVAFFVLGGELISPNKVLENTPSAAFWTTLARGLERQSKESARSKFICFRCAPVFIIGILLDSSFLQQTLTSGYPRLLRLFHDFFVQIAVHTDVTYTQDKQRYFLFCQLYNIADLAN